MPELALVPPPAVALAAVPDAGAADAVVPELVVAVVAAMSGARTDCKSLAKLDSALLPLADAPDEALAVAPAAVDADDDDQGSRLDRMLLIDMADGCSR